MPSLFIAGTGTDVGKTTVTCLLAHALRLSGREVAVLKPVASGYDADAPQKSDAGRLLIAAGKELTAEAIASISPFAFTAPVSPHLAAEREGKDINFEWLVAWTKARSRESQAAGQPLLIEGVGGVMTPLTYEQTQLDWIMAAGLPVLLVGDTKLGAMSHMLTSLKILHYSGLAVQGVVISESLEPGASLTENCAIVTRLAGKANPVFPLPRLPLDGNDDTPHAEAMREKSAKALLSWLQEHGWP